MTHRAYDVVCVGAQLPTLLAGALLAKRGFRVLLVAQDELPPTYEAMPGFTPSRMVGSASTSMVA